MLRQVRPIATGLIATSFALAGCAGSPSVDGSTLPPLESPPTTAVGPSDPEPSSATDSPATPPTAQPTPTPSPRAATPVVTADGVAEIKLLTPTTGNRPYALLEWSAVPGAADYTVSVFTPDGRAWWGWSGPDLAVTLGGLDTDVDLGGPRSGEGVTWFVVARDDQGGLLGVSARQGVT